MKIFKTFLILGVLWGGFLSAELVPVSFKEIPYFEASNMSSITPIQQVKKINDLFSTHTQYGFYVGLKTGEMFLIQTDLLWSDRSGAEDIRILREVYRDILQKFKRTLKGRP